MSAEVPTATERWLATLKTRAAGAVVSAASPPVAPGSDPSASRASISTMLDQGAAALAKHAGPMIVKDVLPAVREDKELQQNVGGSVGSAIGKEIAPWVAVAAGALLIMAGVSVMRFARERAAQKT